MVRVSPRIVKKSTWTSPIGWLSNPFYKGVLSNRFDNFNGNEVCFDDLCELMRSACEFHAKAGDDHANRWRSWCEVLAAGEDIG
jgi:hypothetical protein